MPLYSAAVLLLAAVCCANPAHHTHAPTPSPAPDSERIKKLEQVTEQLARQLMLQQLYVEEKGRSEGDSGLKQLRMRVDGSHSYGTASFTGKSTAAIHDHSNLERTCGLGEMIAVLNGLEFRTRHNDYEMKMPMHNKTYNMLEDVPFPPVPPSVLNKHTVEEQSAELREYFKAWKDANHTHRDYRPYFKPVLCIMEGAWTMDKHIEEPFSSDRHALDASSWFDLQEKVRYTSLTGDRINSQNFAYLPTTIQNITDGVPTIAQWNYRIMCHPVKKEINMSHLVSVDDIAHRSARNYDFDQYLKSRMARFTVDDQDHDGKSRYFQWNEMDEWMSEIPGKDNYGAHIIDNTFGLPKPRLDHDVPINVGYYHRRWKVGEHDAMGDTVGHRGFADRNLFVAENTQPRIAPTKVHYCCRSHDGHVHRVCADYEKRLSYAFPLELIFMTPLNSWNPYNIHYHGKFTTHEAAAVTADHRNGGKDQATAYNGTHSKAYYFTPVEFFSGQEVAHDPADTTRAATGVLDPHGNVRLMKSSGCRTQLPNIAGVGSLRTRYPLMPVQAEGSPVWKELEALRDLVMDLDGKKKLLRKVPQGLNTYNAVPSHHG